MRDVILDQMKDYAREHDVPIMQDAGVQFLLKTIQETNVLSILELGTAIGFSSIQMAKLNPEIHIDTLELDEERYHQAIQNIEKENLSHRIDCYLTDIFDFEPKRRYDLVFVDAAKAQYRRYMEKFEPFLNPGGYFFFDNLLFHGLVDHPERTMGRGTRQLVGKIRRFRDYILTDEQFETKYYPNIGDGVAIVHIKDGKDNENVLK